jgi:hypothetical protein
MGEIDLEVALQALVADRSRWPTAVDHHGDPLAA